MNPPIKNKVLRTAVSFLFVIHILVLIKFILLKNPGNLKYHFIEDYSWQVIKQNASQGNYIPFYSINYYENGTEHPGYTMENLFGNVILFIPSGLLIPCLFRTVNTLRKVVLVNFLVSLAFEVIQLITVLGSFDVDDIILNMLGATIGFMMYVLSTKLIKQRQSYSSE